MLYPKIINLGVGIKECHLVIIVKKKILIILLMEAQVLKQTLIIPGELPDLNTYINAERTNKFIGAKIKKEFTTLIHLECLVQKLIPFDKPVSITYLFLCKNKKKDKSNISAMAIKIIEDGLVTAGILKNDGWDNIEEFSCCFEVVKEKPEIRVEITQQD